MSQRRRSVGNIVFDLTARELNRELSASESSTSYFQLTGQLSCIFREKYFRYCLIKAGQKIHPRTDNFTCTPEIGSGKKNRIRSIWCPNPTLYYSVIRKLSLRFSLSRGRWFIQRTFSATRRPQFLRNIGRGHFGPGLSCRMVWCSFSGIITCKNTFI